MWAFKHHTVLVEIQFDLIGACFGLDLIWRGQGFSFFTHSHTEMNSCLVQLSDASIVCLRFWQKFLLLDELSKNQSSVIRSELRPKPEDCSVTIDNLTAKWNPVGVGMCLYSDTHQSVVGVRGCTFIHVRVSECCVCVWLYVCPLVGISVWLSEYCGCVWLYVCPWVCVWRMCWTCLCVYVQLYSGDCWN